MIRAVCMTCSGVVLFFFKILLYSATDYSLCTLFFKEALSSPFCPSIFFRINFKKIKGSCVQSPILKWSHFFHHGGKEVHTSCNPRALRN